MLLLALDTSTQAGSLAVLRDERILGAVSTFAEETYSSRMFRHLDFLLQELRVALADFDCYAVAAGPGSFTGLRVGLAAVKGWAEVHGKPIVPVSALEATAAQAHSAEPLLVPIIDARRGQIYAGLYDRRGDALARRGDEMVLTPDEFLRELARLAPAEPLAFVTAAPEILAGPLEKSSFQNRPMETVSAVLAPVLGRLGYERARRGETVDALHLDANYVRRSDAELLWKRP